MREALRAAPMPYWCSNCRRHFSVGTGTALAHSKVLLRNRAVSIYLEAMSPKGTSSIALGARHGGTAGYRLVSAFQRPVAGGMDLAAAASAVLAE